MRCVSLMAVACLSFGAESTLAAPTFPLKVGADQRHLVDQNNVPFLLNGDAPWSLMVRATRSEVTTYFGNRKAKGFNAVLTNIVEHAFAADPPKNAYGDAPFTTPGDFSTPNEAYFAHVDWVVGEAAQHDILLLLTPAYLGYGCGSQGWCQEMQANGTTKMYNYGAYLGARYKDAKNILWVDGGDADAVAFGALNVVNALANGIKSVDTSHLHTAHCDRQQSGLDCYDQPWLNVNTTYSDCTLTAQKIRTDYERSKVIPFFYIEGDYESFGAFDSCIRSQAYWALLGGSFGHVFGNYPIWDMSSGWQSALDSIGATSMSWYARLFASRRWHGLVPDYAHVVVTSGYGSIGGGSYVAGARTADGATVIVYLPSAVTVTVNMSQVNGANATAWWFNPANGATTSIGTFAASGSRNFTPPAPGDWVLVIDNAALGLPAPGTTTWSDPNSADLSVTKVVNSDTAVIGNSLTYTLTASNTGPSAASNVAVSDPLPANVIFNSVSAGQGSCGHASGTVSCNIGQMSAGQVVQIQITVQAASNGAAINTATVTSLTTDPNSANNTATAQTTIGATVSADLALGKTANLTTTSVGSGFTYMLSVTNAGPNTASNVTVSDPLPDIVSFVSASSGQGSCSSSAGTVSCSLGQVTAGQTVQIQIAVQAASSGLAVNTANVASYTADPGSGNNASTVQTTINPVADPDPLPASSSGHLSGGGKCAMSVAADQTWMADRLRYVRSFRDRYLQTNAPGRALVRWYYRVSPSVAHTLRQHREFLSVARVMLAPLVLLSEAVVGDHGYRLRNPVGYDEEPATARWPVFLLTASYVFVAA